METNNETKRWTVLIGVSVAVALGLGTLIYFQHEKIEEERDLAARIRGEITSARQLIKKTPDLVKEVIIKRETDSVIKTVLADQEDINNFVRTITDLSEESDFTISRFREVPSTKKSSRRGKKKEAFGRVRYTFEAEADIFQFLAFIAKVESYPRLMSVADFKLTSARRQSYDSGVEPRHRITLDIETYAYNSVETQRPVRIDNYERKRDLLVSEITKRTAEIVDPPYPYRGQQGRRDPWVDPRVPVSGPDAPTLTIEEQIAIVDDLVAQAEDVETRWSQVEKADNLIAQMRARSECEESLMQLEEQVRKVESAAEITFVPAAKRMESQVIFVARDVRAQLEKQSGRSQGPTVAALELVRETMDRHIADGLFEAALETFADIELRLPQAEREPSKQPIVAELYERKAKLEAVLEFDKIELEISGVALYEDRRPVALINGTAYQEGELIDTDLMVQSITIDQIEFAFRGVRIGRQLDEFMTRSPRNQESRR